jgi:2,3-bisphosphoglycerate-independent phosphoglycerate mutase
LLKFLFLFLDGVGLGENDPFRNPFAAAHMPNCERLLGGHRLLAESAPLETIRTSLFALDACLGIPGLPQSATGQAALLTGKNVPAHFGGHYGPKPNPQIAQFLQNGALFKLLIDRGLRVGFLNAYPSRYFDGIKSGRRLYSAIPLAAVSAGLNLASEDDLEKGLAISADFTGQGWRDHLGLQSTKVLSPIQAGQRLAELAANKHFSFFEYWLSDYAGHRQEMDESVSLLESFDEVLGGLVDGWNDQEGLILLTSDHGNLEDLSTRKHTINPVPALVVGASHLRRKFGPLSSLTSVAPAILNFLS